MLGAGALLVLSKNDSSTPPPTTAQSNVIALTSSAASAALSNIASVYGASFASQLNNAVLTQNNAAGVFQALGYNIPIPQAVATSNIVPIDAAQLKTLRKTISEDQNQINILTRKLNNYGFSYGTVDAINSYVGNIADLQKRLAAAGLN